VKSVAVVRGSNGVVVADWRRFGRPSVEVSGWKTRVVVVEVFGIQFSVFHAL